MAELVVYSPLLDCIYVYSTGVESLEEIRHTIARVNELSRKHQNFRLIVDVRKQAQPLTLMEVYDLCQNHLRYIDKRIIQALLTNNPPAHAHLFFIERSNNLGFKTELFLSSELAIKWLRGELKSYTNPCNGKIKFPSLIEKENTNL